MKTLLIDGGLVRLAAASMLSGAEPTIMPTAEQEVTRRFAKIVLGLVTQHSPDAAIFAKDRGPYLRAAEYLAWYKGQVWASVVGEDIYMKYDNCVMKVIVQDGIRKLSKPLAKADRLAVEQGANWETDMDETLMALAPKYKGKRKDSDYSALGFETRAEFYMAVDTAIRRISEYLASSMKSYVAEIVGWEADDIAGVYCAVANPKVNSIILATVDSDWQQIACPIYPPKNWINRVVVHDLYHDQMIGYADREAIQPKILQKIIGGDTSDNIPGLPKGDNGKHGKSVDISKLDLHELLETHEGKRNKALILLPTPWIIAKPGVAKATLSEGLKPAEANGLSTWVHLAEDEVASIKDRNQARGIVNKLLARKTQEVEDA